ncbi:hypothetical protein LBMAG42_52330 [Deltaproteobacteria bacterium]|nr:hypothetical protein LBMAG42_52330 [Deltaproteobacteria bacterium]
MLLLLSFAFAAARCPSPDPLAPFDSDTAPDGAEYQLVEGAEVVCWWIVPDLGAARIAHRWSKSDRYPLRIESLADGRAFFVMNDLRVQLRNADDDRYRNLDLRVHGDPMLVLAHSRRDWVAVTSVRDDDTTLVELLDLDRERVLGSVALSPTDLAISFVEGDDVLWLDGAHALALTESGLRVREQSP